MTDANGRTWELYYDYDFNSGEWKLTNKALVPEPKEGSKTSKETEKMNRWKLAKELSLYRLIPVVQARINSEPDTKKREEAARQFREMFRDMWSGKISIERFIESLNAEERKMWKKWLNTFGKELKTKEPWEVFAEYGFGPIDISNFGEE